MLVDIDYNEEEEEEEESKKPIIQTIKIEESKVDKRVRDLISLICDIKAMNQTMIELQIDVKKMPLGMLAYLLSLIDQENYPKSKSTKAMKY